MVALRSILALSSLILASSAQNPPVRYMPLGDSITEGSCWRAQVYFRLATDGYNVDFVGSETHERSTGCQITVYDRNNEGHPGFSAVGIADQNLAAGWLQQNPADMVTMHLGTNDIRQGLSNDAIIAAYTKIVEQMRASNPRMKIIVAQIIPMFIDNLDVQIQDLNSRIPGWAASLNTADSPIWVVDQHTGIVPEDLYDGIHTTEAGDEKLTARWYPAVVEAVKQRIAGTKREIAFES